MIEKKDPPKKTLQSTKRKPPASLFLWLLTFLILALLIAFHSSSYFSYTEDWTADRFLAQLDKGVVLSAEIMPESDRILAISGEFKDVAEQIVLVKKAQDASAASKKDADENGGKAAAEMTEADRKAPAAKASDKTGE